jgi:hypothetical protein
MSNVLTVNEILTSAQRLDPRDFEELAERIQSMRSQRLPFELTDVERRLLDKITSGVPRHKQLRFDYLIARRDAQLITPAEYQELLSLTEEIEKFDLLRLKRMSKLADLKKITLPEVVHLFKLHVVQHC